MSAIGFKAVHGGRVSGVQRVDDDVLAAMEEMNPVAPAHNPPYIAAMRLLAEKLPEIPLVAAFETGFHATFPTAALLRRCPTSGPTELHVKRWGFHGASHRYIAGRIAELLGRDDLRVISCHLGGSSSLCAIRDGQSVGTSMGMSPQSGVPHNNRVGDFDPFALPVIMKATGKSLDEVLDDLACRSGSAGSERCQRRRARPGASGRRRATREPVWRWTCLPKKCAAISAGCWWNWAGWTSSCSPAASARTPPPIRALVCENLDGSGDRAGRRDRMRHAKGECQVRPATTAQLRSGWFPRTKNWSWPGRLANYWRDKGMFVAKVTGSLVSTQKVDTMVGYKLLVVEPYRLDAATARPAGDDRPHVCRRRHAGRRRRRLCADRAGIQRSADAGNQEYAHRHRGHRARRHGARRATTASTSGKATDR